MHLASLQQAIALGMSREERRSEWWWELRVCRIVDSFFSLQFLKLFFFFSRFTFSFSLVSYS
jgi:hypothetical protein